MSLVCYCKKCKREVPIGETCQLCGSKLTKATQRISFQCKRTPVKDWMRWNSILRFGIPVWLAVCAVVIGFEAATSGWLGASRLLRGPTGTALIGTFAGAFVLTGIWLLACGSEDHYYFLDNKGIHLTIYVSDATPINRLARLIRHNNHVGDSAGLYAGQKQLSWNEIKRVQVWRDKNRILIYAPAWWMQLAIMCPSDQFEEALTYIKAKLNRRKDVIIQYTPPEAN